MKLIKSKYIHFIILLVASSFVVKGQVIERQVVGVGGGSIQTASGYSSFTMGEAIMGTLTNEEMVLTQGFQQNYFLSPNNVTEMEVAPLDIYPNPVIDKIFIRETDVIFYDKMVVTNVKGQVVFEELFPINDIAVEDWEVGNYFLYILEKGALKYAPFKIVKLD